MGQHAALAALLAVSGTACGAAPRDRFGGWTGVRGKATGFFHAQQVDGRWWLITPEGNAFHSKGVNHVSYTADQSPALGYSPYARVTAAKYGSEEKWAAATADRLRGWGFNTVGSWSGPVMWEQKLPYTVILGLAAGAGSNWLDGKTADVFSPAFARSVQERAQRLCAPRARDPFLLGYFTDNELRWGPDWRSKRSLLEDFLTQGADAPGKQVALRLIRARYPTVDALNAAWGTQLKDLDELKALTSLPMGTDAARAMQSEFLREYSRTYFRTCRDAIRAADPNHMILGCRFAGQAPRDVVGPMGEFVEVASFNDYGRVPPEARLRELHEMTGRPVMLTEFSFKAQDSGLPNTKGAGRPVPTQEDRAEGFDGYVTALLKLPYAVGFHWFEYCDEPAEGRFDGENSNYGLVNIRDEPWQVLVERMTRVNAGLEEVHRGAAGMEQR